MGNNDENNWNSLDLDNIPNLNDEISESDNIEDVEVIEDIAESEIEEVTAEEVRYFNQSYTEAKDENFSEVLQLTQYAGENLMPASTVVAEYSDIDLPAVKVTHQKTAESFVNKITKFILEFKDVELSEAHKSYLKQVAKLQVSHLEDLLELVDINKQMLQNIVRRVNATQAEDYAVITSYNNLSNHHLKLLKELQNTYKAIPSVLKKMRADVVTNQELGEPNTEEVITENYGKTQFNNNKQLLRELLEKDDNEKSASC